MTPFMSLCFLPSFTQASKPTTHTTTAALHVPEPMTATHPKNNPTMDPPSRSPVPPTVTNAFKEENRGGDGPCEMIKMATQEEKVLGIVLTKDDDDKRRLKISTNENDAITRVDNDAIEGYEHFGKGAVL
jgi:hypothetical protein